MRKITLFLLTLLLILTGCSDERNKDVESSNDVQELEEKGISDIDNKELETYLIMNGCYNLVFNSADSNEQERKQIVRYNSYIPTSALLCSDTIVEVECLYDETLDKWNYGRITKEYIGETKQPYIIQSLDMANIGINEVMIPFSWDMVIDYDNYDSQLFNYEKQIEKEYFLKHTFYFQNEEMLVFNHLMSVNPMAPDYTKEYNTDKYNVMHVFYEESNNLGYALLEEKDKALYLLKFNHLLYEDQKAIVESINKTNSIKQSISNTSIDTLNIDYNEQLFKVKLKYNMRIRSNKNQMDNVIRMAETEEEFSVYKVINDGIFTWYCIGENMWLGDDGTCLEIMP